MSLEGLRAELGVAEGVLLFADLGAPAGVLAEVRRRFRAAGLVARSVRTQQLRRAVVGTPYVKLQEFCAGALLVVVVAQGAAAAAKLGEDVARLSDRLRVRACAVPGELLELDEMRQAPSLGAERAALLAVLRWGTRSLVELLVERALESVDEVSSPDVCFAAIAGLTALRRRLAPLLAGPGRGHAEGCWCEGPLDARALFAEVSGLRLRPGWQLGAYAVRCDGEGDGVVWALPPGSPRPRRPDRSWTSRSTRPWPPGGRRFAEAIEGDDSLLSYLHASILAREVEDYGLLGHGVGWDDHQLVDRVPEDQPWRFRERAPRRLWPRVTRRGGEVFVELWSVNRCEQVRLYRHLDRYVRGEYVHHAALTLVATGGFGYVH